jgi:hypothetical protein
MKVNMEHAAYTVNYIESNGKWYFNYCKTDVAFKVRWTNRFFGLFSTTYTIGSKWQLPIATATRVKFPRQERINLQT